MWAIFSGDTPIFYGENLDDLQATCDQINLALGYTLELKEWDKHGLSTTR